MRSAFAALAGAAFLLAVVAGCMTAGPDPAPPTTPRSTFNPAVAAPEATFGPGLEIEVVYSGMWSGAWGSAEAKQSDEGFGNTTRPLPPNLNRVEATFQKQETTDETLVLRLVQNGTVLKEASGSGPLAVVTLEATPAR